MIIIIINLFKLKIIKVTETFGANNSATAEFPTALVTSAFVTPQLFAQYYNIPLNYRGVSSKNIQVFFLFLFFINLIIIIHYYYYYYYFEIKYYYLFN